MIDVIVRDLWLYSMNKISDLNYANFTLIK